MEGALLMLAFGLGTVPAMLPMTLGAASIFTMVKKKALRLIAGLLIAAGGLYILQHSIMMLTMKHNPASMTKTEETVEKEHQHRH